MFPIPSFSLFLYIPTKYCCINRMFSNEFSYFETYYFYQSNASIFSSLNLLRHSFFITFINSLSNSNQHSANADMIADVKSKIIVLCRHFLPTWFFLPHQKFKTIKIKLEKKTYTQVNTCLLHISRNLKDIFKYICFSLYLKQTVNNWESAIIFIDYRCLPCFFFNRY